MAKTTNTVEWFPITRLHRDDIKSLGFVVEEFSDDEMRRIAKAMENDYMNQLYWGSLRIITGQVLSDREPEKKNKNQTTGAKNV
jgi:hypothetical protein